MVVGGNLATGTIKKGFIKAITILDRIDLLERHASGRCAFFTYAEVIKMTIGEIMRYKAINTYRKLLKMCSKKIDKPKKEIELGDSVENLMKANSYRREGRRLKQTKWG